MSAAVATAPSPVPVAHPQTGEFIDGQTLRFAVPTDGTLQFLPGRLEVVAGPDAGREIRFVRLPGEPSVDITFGRTSGPAYSHVQLHARTVSRQHAVMSLLDDHWQLQNLSQTNPVVLNGRPLADQEIAPLLVDGDRIEMGEIVFVFRGR
jgi:pSer/pThr/pTyr-binding forkhead associated (FHA) protein